MRKCGIIVVLLLIAGCQSTPVASDLQTGMTSQDIGQMGVKGEKLHVDSDAEIWRLWLPDGLMETPYLATFSGGTLQSLEMDQHHIAAERQAVMESRASFNQMVLD